MGALDEWLGGLIDKAKKVIDDEVTPFAEKLDKLAGQVEDEAKKIRDRSEELVRQAEEERDGPRERLPATVDGDDQK